MFTCQHCNLTEIPFIFFMTYVNIETLFVERANITKLQPNLFAVSKKLKVIEMGGNQLRKLQGNAFNGAVELVELNLSNCSLEALNSRTFDGLSKLQRLDLSENKLHQLPYAIFEPLFSITMISLKSNALKSIGPDTFNNMPNLATLLLNQNQLIDIDMDTFNNTDAIHSLHLSDNPKIETIELHREIMASIKSYHVSNCGLTELIIPPNADTISAHNNRITVVKKSSLNIPLVRHLFLADNQFSSFNTLKLLSNLIQLQLADNQIKMLDYNVLANFRVLSSLGIARNPILRPIDADKLSKALPKLKLLKVAQQKWSDDHMRMLTEKLYQLKIDLTIDSDNKPDWNNILDETYIITSTEFKPTTEYESNSSSSSLLPMLTNEKIDCGETYKSEYYWALSTVFVLAIIIVFIIILPCIKSPCKRLANSIRDLWNCLTCNKTRSDDSDAQPLQGNDLLIEMDTVM